MKHTFKPCHGGCELKRFFVILIALVMCIAATVSAAESATAKLSELYAEAELLLVEGSYDEAAAKFDALGSYSDASKMAMYCKAISMAETYKMYTIAVDTLLKLGEFKDCEQLAVYYTGRGTEDAGDIVLDNIDKASDDDIKKAIKCYEDADKMYTELMLFKDSMIRAAQVAGKKKQLEEEQEIRSGNSKENAYLTAKAFEEQSKWDEAIATYETIKDYKDSSDRIDFCALAQKKEHYEIGIALLEEKKWDDALVQFTAASDYEDSANLILETYLRKGIAFREESKWDEAFEALELASGHPDAKNEINETKYQMGLDYLNKGEWDSALKSFDSIKEYSDTKTQIKKVYYEKGISHREKQEWMQAIDAFKAADNYEDAKGQITETYYQQAKALYDNGEYKKAYNLYMTIHDYKDVVNIIPLVEDAARNALQKALEKPYGIITMGKYEQDGNLENGPEDIEWIVLEVQKNKALLLSRKIIEAKAHKAYPDYSWEKSKIREWLNSDFLLGAFNENEQMHIEKSKISNKSVRKTKSWKNTTDSLFLLSEEEVQRYFPVYEDRIATITDYVYELCTKESYTFVDRKSLSRNSNGDWWLRSSGNNEWDFLDVARKDGRTFGIGEVYCCADTAELGIRPAFWLKITPDFF